MTGRPEDAQAGTGQRVVRILSLGSVPPEWGGRTRGGVATCHAALVEELARTGHGLEIVGVLPFNGGLSDRIPAPVSRPNAGEEDRDLYARALAEARPDVVVCHHVTNRWARLHAECHSYLPFVGVVHSWHPITFKKGIARERVARSAQFVLDRIGTVVFPSAFARDEGAALGFSYPKRVEVVACPIGRIFTVLGPERVSATPREGVLFVGSLIERKNPAVAIRASALAGIPLTIVGDGPQRSNLERLAGELGARVSFAGARSPVEVRDYMLRSELLCLPSSSESLGMVFIEALACGTPVTGFAGTLDEIFTAVGRRCGTPVVRPEDPRQLAVAFGRIRDERWDRLNLHRRAVDAFSPQVVAASYSRLLREVVGSPGAELNHR